MVRQSNSKRKGTRKSRGAEPRDQKEYFEKYYQDNQDRILASRRVKYAEDPAYAEMQRKRAKDYRERKRQERLALIEKTGKEPRRGGGPRRPVEVAVRGKPQTAFTIGHVAGRVGRSIHTLRRWRNVGVLPPSPLTTAKGDSLYTEDMILVMKQAILRRGEVSIEDKSFTQEILSGWRDLGLKISA